MPLFDRLRRVFSARGRASSEARADGSHGERDERRAARPPAQAPRSATALAEETLRDLRERLSSTLAGTRQSARDELTAGAAPDRLAPSVEEAVAALVAADRVPTAIELLTPLATLAPDAPALAARAAELLCERLQHEVARPLLAPLADAGPFAARARFLLAEGHERAGDLERARRQYERVLAIDIDFPQARARWERLRAARGAVAAAVAPTVTGLGEDGPARALEARIGDRYRLRRELGRGGAGAVYLARDEELDRDVALKLLHPRSAGRLDAAGRLRAFHEARMAAALRHPSVAFVYELDEERGLIAMEPCWGGSLRDRLARGRVPVDEALRLAASLARTLAFVHRSGVVHGDVKPANLMFRDPSLAGERPRPVLVDFGLAAFQRSGGDAIAPDETATDEADADADPARAAGTLAYLAPEWRRGEARAATAASDVFALGVVLLELLTGERPSEREGVLWSAPRLHGPPPPSLVDRLGPARAAAVAALVSALLADDPRDRPAAADAGASLARIARDA